MAYAEEFSWRLSGSTASAVGDGRHRTTATSSMEFCCGCAPERPVPSARTVPHLERDLTALRRWSASVLDSFAVVLTETMSESWHHTIYSTTVRAMFRPQAEKVGLIA